MSDEHGWPDLSDPHGHDDHGDKQDAGVHQEPPPGADDALHDHLYGHDDPDPDGFDPVDPYAADAHAADDPGSDDPDGSDPDAHDVADAGGNEPGTGHDDPGVDVTDGHGMGPPGVDPLAALADSDDPATGALAEWWRPR